MVTLQERQKARQAKFKAKFAAQKKTRSTTLSKVAETTAQRRGRGFDPLETVIKQAVQPPPPKPKPVKTRAQQACDVLGGIGVLGGPTVSRGASRICGDKPIAFSDAFPSNTSRRVFGQSIASNQAKLRAAGFGDFIPFSAGDRAAAQRQIKILRRKKNFAAIEQVERAVCKRTNNRGGGVVNPQSCNNFLKLDAGCVFTRTRNRRGNVISKWVCP